jgi:hypothetical protein
MGLEMAIYFVQRKETGLIKIGYSGGVPERMASLARQYGELELLAVIEDGTRLAEHNIHKMFVHCHVEGEWFWPRDDLLQFIERARTERALTTVEGVLEFLRTSVALVNVPSFTAFIETWIHVEAETADHMVEYLENTGLWKSAEILLTLGAWADRQLEPGIYCMARDGAMLPNDTRWLGVSEDG